MVDARIEAALATNLLEAGLKGESCAFFLLDENNRFLWVFNPFEGLYDPATMMGRSERDLGMPERVVRSLVAMIERVRQTGSSEQADFWVTAPAGERRCFVVHYQLYPHYNGQRCVLGRAREITGQRLAEEKARQSNLERKARLRELEETSMLLLKAMEGENTSLCLLDEDLRYVRVLNPFPEYPAEYLIGKTDVEVLPTDEARQGMALKRQVLETGKSLTAERWMTFALGERRFVVSHYIPITLASGRPGLIVKVSDRTEERLAEQNQRDLNKALALKVGELEQSERRLSAALEGQDISLILHDENLRILWAFNPPPAWDPESLVGKTVLEIGLKPEDARLTSEYLCRVLETGETQSFEFWVELPNGQRRYNVVTYLPFDLGQGRRGVLGRNLNLTEQKQREQELATLNQTLSEKVAELDLWDNRIRLALRDMPVSLYLQDEDTRFIWCYNPSLPWTEESLIGKSQFEIGLTREDAEAINANTSHAKKTGKPYIVEYWVGHPDGIGSTYYRSTYEPISLGNGKVGILTKAIDLTKDKLAAQKVADLADNLARENARVSELLAQVKSESDFRLSQLREASQMQKAFLPADLLVAGPYTVAASMTTSIEVGGDYYDYRQDGEALTVVIGDATGHGVRAGIMVALVKSYFSSFGASLPPQTFLASLDAHLERMRFKQLYMGLSAFRLEGGLCTYAVAGMPPFFWYHAAGGNVKRLAHKGLFLGAGLAFQYKEHTLTLEPGDILVLVSDGLTEAFDPQGEMLPFRLIRQSIEQAAQAGPQAVVNSLIGQIREWTGKVAVDDDLTILALRYEGQ